MTGTRIDTNSISTHMFAVRFSDREKWSKENLIAIAISFSRGNKLHCESFECIGRTIQTRLLDEQFLKSPAMRVAYRRRETRAEQKCVELLEEQLRQRIVNGLADIDHPDTTSEASDSAAGGPPSARDVRPTGTLRILLSDDRELTIGRLRDFLDARISLAIHSGATSASILAHGIESKTHRQVVWAKEELTEDCEFSLEFGE